METHHDTHESTSAGSDPRPSTEDLLEADSLVAEVMQQSLAGTFAKHKRDLEGQRYRQGTVETEDLRLALQDYRTFFNRLVGV